MKDAAHRLVIVFVLACLVALAGACSTAKPNGRHGDTIALTQEEAVLRRKMVTRVHYLLWFGLDGLGEDFEGRATITFDVKKGGREAARKLFVDFDGAQIRSMSLNGVIVTEPEYDGHRIQLRTADLIAGTNRLSVSYTRPYSRDGRGLHRFQDPVDQRTYLYTDFEPFYAHHVFPCFDQPDLKATYELTVETPPDWQVISSVAEREVAKVDGRQSWIFPPSPPFSTYVFALHAGPYSSWSSDANGIPLRLFARQSLAKHVDFREWFEITAKGLEFFATQFGRAYPFPKYDQVIVPDFNHGGMENVGAVTISESNVFQTPVPAKTRKQRASLLLHELAHMWFGDLVTLNWWNGIWLNESFASFASDWALYETGLDPDAWKSFYGMKQWAYWEDQLVTTHPIESPVADTEQARVNFDGITYAKGAAVLKQLHFFLGEDDFREGLQRYFQKFGFRNTSLSDFVKMLSEASGKDLSRWQKLWLQTSGVNTVQADWSCENGKVAQFALVQSGSELRPHKTQIAFYGAVAGKPGYQRIEKIPVSYSGERTDVPEALGKKCPLLVFPNDEDHDYVKVQLDPVTLETLTRHLPRIQDAFTRQMVWGSLWQMVRDGSLSALSYGESVIAFGAKEENPELLSSLLRTLGDSSATRSSVLKFIAPERRGAFQEKLNSFLHRGLTQARAGSDHQMIWFSAWKENANDSRSMEFALKLLSGKPALKGFKVDQDRRWSLLWMLAKNCTGDDCIRMKEAIEEERRKDPSDLGSRRAIACETALPLAQNKRDWMAKLVQYAENPATSSLSFAKLRPALQSFQVLGQEALIRESQEDYFRALPLVKKTAPEFSSFFTSALYPGLCDPAVVQRVTRVLEENPDFPPSMVKWLKVQRQEDERCIAARAKTL